MLSPSFLIGKLVVMLPLLESFPGLLLPSSELAGG